ncbi:Cholinesterase [Arthrobotrys entomopaga]|nr:Cholinesterase [Arthrobotrys entomopaga]
MKSFINHALSSIVVSSALQIGVSASPTPQGTTVKIANGTVYGAHSSTWNQDFFLGIPYAQPPVGDLRFRPAQHINVKRDFQATEYGPTCYGYGGDNVGYKGSEDFAVWIHGGGFIMGSGSNKRYNMTFLVDQSVKMGSPIIGVSMNYRLAGWGFLSGRQVADTMNLNLGLKDQRVALHWVQENIASFGGNPKKVTIFGESAGGFSVGYQQIAYDGRDDGLFSGAIMQSGNPVNYKPFPQSDTYQKNYEAVLQATGCAGAADGLNCLRTVDTKKLNDAFNTTSALEFGPVVDGEFIASIGSEALSQGKYVKIPTIVGTTSDEGASFGALNLDTEQQIRDYLASTTNFKNGTIDQILKLYNPSVSVPPAENFTHPDQGTALYGKEYHRVAAIVGDLMFIAGRRYTVQTMAAQNTPVWSYRFRAASNGFAEWLRSPHFSEVAYVFNNINMEGYKAGDVYPGESSEPLGGPNAAEYRRLADYMSKSWIRFFTNGDPGAGQSLAKDDVKWIKYQEGSGKSQIVFDIAPHATYMETDDYREQGMAFMISKFSENGI